jgi:probable phosphoglycerate mutase
MPKIYIARHGQDKKEFDNIRHGSKDTDLTPVGEEQAVSLGEKLRGTGVESIRFSPLLRTARTGQIIGSVLGIADVASDDRLLGRDMGPFAGQAARNMAPFAERTLETPYGTYYIEVPGVEPIPSFYTRIAKLMTDIRIEQSTDTLMVTHHLMGSLMIAAHYGEGWQAGLMRPNLDHDDIVELSYEETRPAPIG